MSPNKFKVHGERARELWESGHTDNWITKELGLGAGTVTAWSKRYEWVRHSPVQRPVRVSKFCKEHPGEEVLKSEWEKSKRRKKSGQVVPSALRVTESLEVYSYEDIKKWLREIGLVNGKGYRDPNVSDEDVRRLYVDERLTMAEVARRLGGGEFVVESRLKKMGIPIDSNYRDRWTEEEIEDFRNKTVEGCGDRVYELGRYEYGGFSFDSQWEVNIAKTCDRLGLSWRRFNRRKIEEGGDGLLSHIRTDGRHSLYGPDLLVEDYVVEVKGIFDLDAQVKVNSWREHRGPLALLCLPEYEQFIDSQTREEALQTLEDSLNNSPEPTPYSTYLKSDINYYGSKS